MATRGSSRIDRLVSLGMVRPDPESAAAVSNVDGHLHTGQDAICPRCLSWIEERHYVRQTVYGVLQHEVCPPV